MAQSDRFVLENGKVRLEVSNRGRLLGVGAAGDGHRFEVGQQRETGGGPLWQIVLRGEDGESCIVEPPETCAISSDTGADTESLRLSWDVTVRGEPLTVTMTASLTKEEAGRCAGRAGISAMARQHSAGSPETIGSYQGDAQGHGHAVSASAQPVWHRHLAKPSRPPRHHQQAVPCQT